MQASHLRRAAAALALAVAAGGLLAADTPAPGRWASNDNVATTGSKTGAKFFLDIAAFAAGAGSIELQGLGKSAFRFKRAASPKGQPQLDLELPREWLRQGEPVLYEASLNPKGG